MGREGASVAKGLSAFVAFLAFVYAPLPGLAIDASNRYLSPRNPERRIRSSTQLIVLHTTEAPAAGSLKKLRDRGECHYCVTEDGSVYRIVDRDREAFHAGRSMWNGKEDVDKFSIGIECVGHHDQAMPLAQLFAIRDLVRELKGMYSLTDDKVIPHGAVAYGNPNKWQKKKHRGRKRCGMLFAMPSVRRVLELKSRPALDPDTKAKRLVVGDPYLEGVLYGSTDTMRGTYSKAAILAASAVPPGFFSWFGGKKGNASPAISATPPPQPANPKPAAPPPRARPVPATPPKNAADLRARGYVCRGAVSKGRTASKIVGVKWNSPDTYYTIRNRVTPGDKVNQAKIEIGTMVWTKK